MILSVVDEPVDQFFSQLIYCAVGNISKILKNACQRFCHRSTALSTFFGQEKSRFSDSSFLNVTVMTVN